jgi:Domain of unknown function (DUF4411)
VELYSVDTSSLVNAWNKLYQPDIFPSIWEHIDAAWRTGAIVITEQVYLEIEKKDDELFAWCTERRSLFRPISDPQQDCLTALMSRHRRIAASGSGRNFADPFVIALAQTFSPRLTVITEEDFGKETNPKIPYLCKQEGLQWTNFNGLLRATKWKERD